MTSTVAFSWSAAIFGKLICDPIDCLGRLVAGTVASSKEDIASVFAFGWPRVTVTEHWCFDILSRDDRVCLLRR